MGYCGIYGRAYGDYMRRGLDCQLDLLDYNTDTLSYSAHTLQLTTVDHNTRLETVPQPVFHCNHSYGIPCQLFSLRLP
jgi:hypothetical protein